jgi:hypothetical protein
MLIVKRIIPLFKKNDWVQVDPGQEQEEIAKLAEQNIKLGTAYQVVETMTTKSGCWLRLAKLASLPPPSSIATEFVPSQHFIPV